MTKLSMIVVEALAEAASKYEGTYTEDGKGVHIFLKHKSGHTVEHFIPAEYLPIGKMLRNRYISYQIRQMTTMLDDRIQQFEKLLALPEVAET